jgi:hypothetical protein
MSGQFLTCKKENQKWFSNLAQWFSPCGRIQHKYEHGCNVIVAIGSFMSYIRAMNVVLFALPFVVALAFAALTFREEMR